MPLYARMILVTGWALWLSRYVKYRPTRTKPEKVDRRARWGMLLQAAAFLAVGWHRPGDYTLELWRVPPAILFLLLGSLLSWTSVSALGRHFRVDAGLDTDHQLIRSGAYRFIRHPIYASVLCMLLGTALLTASLPRLLLAMLLGIVGTEIRVHIEDHLLASRFGEDFLAFQRSTPAYIPFLR